MKIRFISPWYPDYANVHSGIFVAKQVEALSEAGQDVTVDVPQIFPAPPGPIPNTVTRAMEELAEISLDAMFATKGGVTYLPTPVPTRGGPMGRAEAMRLSLSLLAGLRPGSADVDHAHLGMPTAWAVAHSGNGVPLVVTEHQSTLGAVLAEPAAAEAYADVIRRSSAFICVSPHLRTQIADALGDWVLEHIEIVPNIVDLEGIPFRERSPTTFSSWVYVGGLMPHKGVQDLLRAFADYVRRHDSKAQLRLVGDGPLRGWIETYASTRAISDSVHLIGSVEHERLGIHLEESDVMVHLSPAETFGIAPLEGIGAGLPVVALRNEGSVGTWGDIEEQCGKMLPLEASPDEIADAIAELRDGPEGLNGAVGRQAVIDRFSPQIVATRLTDIYERVVQ